MKKFLQLIILSLVIVSLFFAPSILAAKISLETENSNIELNHEFEVHLYLNTEKQNINALEGEIVFPHNLIKLERIEDGGSIISFWVDNPQLKNGNIVFSGITPGGFSGTKGLILSMVFRPIKKGKGIIALSKARVLLNDGLGTETKTSLSRLSFIINRNYSSSSSSDITIEKDTTPPDPFHPMVSADETIFGGKYFLVFATQDKESGIDHYEICEGNQKCVVATSPYLLQNQNLNVNIIVKAIDRAGNERDEKLFPQKQYYNYKKYLILVIIILIIVSIYFVLKVIWREKRKIRY